jgi:hypothetical protein
MTVDTKRLSPYLIVWVVHNFFQKSAKTLNFARSIRLIITNRVGHKHTKNTAPFIICRANTPKKSSIIIALLVYVQSAHHHLARRRPTLRRENQIH